MPKISVLLTILFLANQANAQCGQDLTLQEETSGSDVVHAAVTRIQESGIFESDNELLRRIAFVESEDGTNSTTYREGYHGGIWAVDEEKFLATQNITFSITQQISVVFGIDWIAAEWNDLRKPLYSALAARIFLHTVTETIPLSTDIQAQAQYWQLHYNSLGLVSQFVSAISELDLLEECTVRQTDLYFVLDSSGSVGLDNFQLMRDFVFDVTDGFIIGPEDVQIGVISFDSTARFHFFLNTFHNKSNLLDAITNISYVGLSTNTAAALNLLRLEGYTSSNGGRPLSEAIPRVAIVLTDGISDSFVNTINEGVALQETEIQAFAVGIGNNVNIQELEAIASDTSYISLLTGFNASQFDTLRRFINSRVCTVAAEITIGTEVRNTVVSEEVKYFTFQFPSEGVTLQIEVLEGSIVLYATDIIQTPNEALYTWKIATSKCKDLFLDPVLCQTMGDSVNLAIIGLEQVNTFILKTIPGIKGPDPPTNTQAFDIGASSATAAWEAPLSCEIESYNLILTEEQFSISPVLISVNSSIISYTFTELEEFNTYTLSVAAVNNVGVGSFSSVNFTTLQAAPTTSPDNFTIAFITPRSVSLMWDPPSPQNRNGIITGYIINVTVADTGEDFQLSTETTHIFIDSLRPFSIYMYMIAATTVEDGPFSNTFQFQTLEDVPSEPEHVVVLTIEGSPTELQVIWDPPADPNGLVIAYTVYCTASGMEHKLVLSGNTSQVVVTNLLPYTFYDCYVTANTSAGEGNSSIVQSVRTPESVPNGPPENFTIISIIPRSVSLTWDPPPPENRNGIIISYTINLTEGETGQILQIFAETNNLTIDSLRPFTAYILSITATTSVGVGSFSSVLQFTTPEDIPSAPESFVVRSVPDSPSELILTWNLPLEPNGIITAYTVYCSERLSGSGDIRDALLIATDIMITVSENISQVVVTDLMPYTVYDCYITANTSAGEGSLSTVQSARTDESVPEDPPTNVEASAVSATTILLTWSEPLTPNGVIISFTISYSLFGSQEVIVVNNTESYLAAGLEADTVYVFELYASTRVGPGPSAQIQERTIESEPGSPPRDVQSYVISSTMVNITWLPPAIQNGVITYYTLIITEEQFNIGELIINSTTTNYMLTGLEEFNDYSCRVAAATRAGVGPFSEFILFTTLEDVPSSAPQNLSGLAESPTIISLMWKPPPLIDVNGIIEYYEVQITETETERFWNFLAISMDLHVGSLHPFYSYECRVAAHTTAIGPYTNITIIQTLETEPGAPPLNLTGEAISSMAIVLRWSPPAAESQNGLIRHYIVTVMELTTGSTFDLISTDTALTVYSLHPFQTYEFMVSAVTIGPGPLSSPFTVQTAEDVPSAPVDVTGEIFNGTMVLLQWSPPEEPNGILLEYQVTYYGHDFLLSNSQLQQNETEIVDGIYTVNVSATQVVPLIIDGLIPGLIYNFKIRASTSQGYGPNSTTISLEILRAESGSGSAQSNQDNKLIGLIIAAVLAGVGWTLLVFVGIVVYYKVTRTRSFPIVHNGKRLILKQGTNDEDNIPLQDFSQECDPEELSETSTEDEEYGRSCFLFFEQCNL